MIGVAGVMAPMLPTTHFLAPNAPEPCATAPGCFEWYDPLGGRAVAEAAVAPLAERVNRYADGHLERLALDPARLVLLGFSQGGAIAVHAALHRLVPPAALLACTASLLYRDTLAATCTSRPPTLFVHGEADPVVPVGKVVTAAQALTALGVDCHTHVVPGIGHTIDEEGAMVAAMFASERLDAQAQA